MTPLMLGQNAPAAPQASTAAAPLTLHDAVRWPDLLHDLAAALPDRGDDILWCVDRSTLLPPLPVALAVLATLGGEATVSRLVAENSTVAESRTVAGWVYWTARIALRTVTKPEPALVPGLRGNVFVDARLPSLCMLALAAQYADVSPRPLVVRLADLGPVTDGRFLRATTVPVLRPGDREITKVTVDLIELSPRAIDIEAVWLHELAHLLDDQPGIDLAGQEVFADALANLLAIWRPADLGMAAELIAAARTPIRPATQPREEHEALVVPGRARLALPDPGPASVLAFATLPLQRQPTCSPTSRSEQTDD